MGDLAETIAHLLPDPGPGSDSTLAEWVTGRLLPLRRLPDEEREQVLLAAWRELDEAFGANRDPLTGKYPASPEYERLFQRIVHDAPAPIGLGG